MGEEQWYYWRDSTLFLHIYLQPRASKDRVVGIHDNCLKISLTTPPVDGKANQHLIAFLAECFKVPKSNVSLIKGETGRRKTAAILKPNDTLLIKKYG